MSLRRTHGAPAAARAAAAVAPAPGRLEEGSPLSMATRWIAGSLAMNGSVDSAAISSPSANATALHGASKLHVAWHSPVFTSQSLADESADPVSRRSDSRETSQVETAPLCPT